MKYRKAIALSKSLEKNGQISPSEALEKITKEMDEYWDLYESPNVNKDTKADLLKGFLLLQEYQIKLMDEMIPRSGVIVSDTIIENEDALAENQTEFDVTMKAEITRSFKVPEMKFDEELLDLRRANAQGDSEWLRLAEYQYYGNAMFQFMQSSNIDSDDSIHRWEQSLAIAKSNFAELVEYDSSGTEALFYPSYRHNIYNQVVPNVNLSYSWPLITNSFSGDYRHLRNPNLIPGDLICKPFTSYNGGKYDECEEGMISLRDHAFSNHGEDSTDMPAELLRFISRDHVADKLDEDRNGKKK